MGPDRTRVYLACSGLGIIRRGYESFMRACFETLRHDPTLDVQLFKGAGEESVDEHALWNFSRDTFAARTIGALTRRGPYVIEQVTFALSLIPHIVRDKPDVIFFSDPAIGKMLSAWRRIHRGAYSLVFHNSGPITPPFPRFDHIQQVTPVALQEAIAAGETPDRQTLLPCALDIAPEPQLVSGDERRRRRRALGFPEDRPVVLSVGAINRNHKRMDYLIREIAALPQPRPFLAMLGQEEADTPAVRTMASLLLGEGNYAIRSVPSAEVAEYYRAADVFTLASLREGFGLGYAEALQYGLPCIAHDFPIARYVLGTEGIFADLRTPGALAHAIQVALDERQDADVILRRHAFVASRFGWPQLAPQYARMLRECTPRSFDTVAVTA